MHPSHLALALALSASAAGAADLRLPGIFGDHMVLQQGRSIPVWGWADPGTVVSVTLGALHAQATAGADGRWRADLPATVADRRPRQLVVSGPNTVTIDDVLVGDVWLCSGQSNMQFGILNLAKRDSLADEPDIRVFCLTKSASLTPMDDTTAVPKELVWDTATGHWSRTPDAGSWGGFSAVGWLFGQRIHALTGQPVGLIGSYWGGTPAQAWTSRAALASEPALAHYVEQLDRMTPERKARYPVVWADYVRAMRIWSHDVWEPDQRALHAWEAAVQVARAQGTPLPPKPQPTGRRPADPGNEGAPTTLFNGMINPLIPYALKGVIWYQGEANVMDGAAYAGLFRAMIRDWRQRWGQADLPFLFVQLAGYGPGPTDGTRGRWAALREAQRAGLSLPATAMAVAVDIGEANDIHPRNKGAVADRLALAASRLVYGRDVVASGPTFAGVQPAGDGLRVAFGNCAGGLRGLAAGSGPAGFQIAGADRRWHRAEAVIDGDGVVVASPQVAAPVAVRYAWGDCPACGLANAEGLPAVPFRTDDWDPTAAPDAP